MERTGLREQLESLAAHCRAQCWEDFLGLVLMGQQEMVEVAVLEQVVLLMELVGLGNLKFVNRKIVLKYKRINFLVK